MPQQPPGADGLMMGDGGRVSDRMSGEPASHIMGHMVVRAAGEAWQDLALFHRPWELQGEPHPDVDMRQGQGGRDWGVTQLKVLGAVLARHWQLALRDFLPSIHS